MKKRKTTKQNEFVTVRPMNYLESVAAAKEECRGYSLSQTVNAAVDRYCNLVCFDGLRDFAYQIAELEVLIYQSEALYQTASDSVRKEIDSIRLGVAQRPVLGLLTAVRDVIGQVRIDKPTEASSIREMFASVGVPSKPYEVLAIVEEIESPFRTGDSNDWVLVSRKHLKFGRTKISQALNNEPDKLKRTDQRDFIEMRKSLISTWVKENHQINYL